MKNFEQLCYLQQLHDDSKLTSTEYEEHKEKILPYHHERGPTTEYRPIPHFGLLESSVYSNMCPCVAALENACMLAAVVRTADYSHMTSPSPWQHNIISMRIIRQKWCIRHTLSLMRRTHPPLRDYRDNAKLASHCTAHYKIEWIYNYEN